MKNKFKIQKIIFSIALVTIFSSCLSNVDEVEELDPCGEITFALNVKPIIDTNCVQCHGSGGNFPNLTTYEGVSANATLVKSETVSGRMPQGAPLSDSDIQAISCWVDSGAPNN